jgi:hypothetical protein
MEEGVGVKGDVMTMTMQGELGATVQKHFASRAQETRELAALPVFKSRRDQLLALARRYEVLAHSAAQSQPALRARRARP